MTLIQLNHACQKAMTIAYHHHAGAEYWRVMAHLRKWYHYRYNIIYAGMIADKLIARWKATV